jgi:hypothetical protein
MAHPAGEIDCVSCPRCGAAAGEPCTDPITGGRLVIPHPARVQAAQNLASWRFPTAASPRDRSRREGWRQAGYGRRR